MIRRQGVDSVEACSEVTLETSGVITVIAKDPSASDLANQAMLERLERIEARLERLLTGGSTPGGSTPGGSTPDGSTPDDTAPGGAGQEWSAGTSASQHAQGGQDTPHTRRPPFTLPADGGSA
jgi:hypothetical protein